MTKDFEPLEGRSKAKVEFDYNKKLVRKTDLNDTNRLIKQAQKQKDFTNKDIKNIKTPKILNIGKNYFNMEFINGKNFIQFVEDKNIENVIFQIDNIINYLNEIKKMTIESDVNFHDAMFNKLETLETEKLHPKIYDYIIEQLTNEELKIESTFCHGDLSLSNMIFKDKEIFLVDFLDPFFNTYLTDIAKIRQDSLYFWLFRVNSYSSIKCEIITKKINLAIEKEFKEELSTIEFKLIELINFLRIEPYTNNQTEKALLNATIYNIFNSISR